MTRCIERECINNYHAPTERVAKPVAASTPIGPRPESWCGRWRCCGSVADQADGIKSRLIHHCAHKIMYYGRHHIPNLLPEPDLSRRQTTVTNMTGLDNSDIKPIIAPMPIRLIRICRACNTGEITQSSAADMKRRELPEDLDESQSMRFKCSSKSQRMASGLSRQFDQSAVNDRQRPR